MSFFGAVFAALMMQRQWHIQGLALAAPFTVFAIFVILARGVRRLPGPGIVPTRTAWRAIVWSTVGEVLGICIASGVTAAHHRPDLFIPAIAIIVGLHFIPIGYFAPLASFFGLAGALLVAGAAGFILPSDIGGIIAGTVAAASLWIAAALAINRDRLARTGALNA